MDAKPVLSHDNITMRAYRPISASSGIRTRDLSDQVAEERTRHTFRELSMYLNHHTICMDLQDSVHNMNYLEVRIKKAQKCNSGLEFPIQNLFQKFDSYVD
jgi:hypothetical protein